MFICFTTISLAVLRLQQICVENRLKQFLKIKIQPEKS